MNQIGFSDRQLMRLLSLSLAVASTMTLVSCASPPTVTSDSTAPDPVRALGGALTGTGLELEGQFTNGTYSMPTPDAYRIISGRRYGLTGLRGRTLPNGIKQVQATLINNSRFKVELQYRFQFFDETGFQVEAEKYPWLRVQIAPGNQAPITGTSYSGRVASFRVYVKS